jgi:hypothetical protein
MRRKILAVVGAGAILLSLTACGPDTVPADAGTTNQIKQLQEFKQACHEAHGYVTRDFWNNATCVVDDALTGGK